LLKIEDILTTYNNVKCVDSYNLYIACGCNKKNYSRWIKDVISYAFNDIDYIEVPTENMHKTKRRRYYLTLDLSASLCYSIKTSKSLQLRRILLRARD